MQKEVFYGLSVYPSINTTEKQYLDVKACIEKAGAQITQLSRDTQVKEKLKESQPIIFWFALSTPFYLTANLSADNLQFAVYNCKTKEIMQLLSFCI